MHKRLALAAYTEGWVGLQYGWFSFRQGILRLWVVEKSGASSRSDFSAAHIICNKTQCWKRRGGYVSMYECIRVRSSGTGVWLIHHSAALDSFSHYTCALWNLMRHNFSLKKKKKGARKESLEPCHNLMIDLAVIFFIYLFLVLQSKEL